MSPEQVAGLVRALLAAVGGFLVSKGLVDDSTLQAVAGAVATLVTAVWSFVAKKKPEA